MSYGDDIGNERESENKVGIVWVLTSRISTSHSIKTRGDEAKIPADSLLPNIEFPDGNSGGSMIS
jgi:hypothetical protein